MDPALAALDVMRDAAPVLRGLDTRAKLRALQAVQDAADAAKAELLAELRDTADHELDGCSTVSSWVRSQLRMTAPEARRLVQGAATMTQLEVVAESARAGRIRGDHLAAFTRGLRLVGPEVMREQQHALVAAAEDHDPATLEGLVTRLHERVNTDALDDAYARALDRQDVTLVRVGDMYRLRGDLNPVTGAKVKAVLDSVSAPHGADDDRTAAQRRVQGLDDLATTILAHGLPSDQGVRPQMSVLVDAATLAAAREHATAEADAHARRAAGDVLAAAPASPRTTGNPAPAELTGWGAVGPQLLGHLACLTDLTALLTTTADGTRQADVLAVGRQHRLATPRQRHAITARQHGRCAAPGCTHTHLDVHHVTWWSRGGTTDLDNLIGLCSRCHHLVHRELLHITGTHPDGWHFTTRHGHPVQPRHRQQTAWTTAA